MVDTSGGATLEAAVVDMPAPRTSEHPVRAANGFVMLGVATALTLGGIALLVVGIAMLASGAGQGGLWVLIVSILTIVLGFFTYFGLTAVAPGEARVVQLLGRYVGTLRTPGLRWVNPITARRRVSTRIRNHETGVDEGQRRGRQPDRDRAVVVWQVEDTAQAVFEVDDFLRVRGHPGGNGRAAHRGQLPVRRARRREAVAARQRRRDHRAAVRGDRGQGRRPPA